uniref:Uncharacterized protein n=1 Tax=Bactrocera latifrons TaxID=174628 RepID=A0A0K8WCA5_BACLA
MSKPILFTNALLLVLVLCIAENAEDATRLARHRHRILHHRYPQAFRHKPSAEDDDTPRRGGYRPSGYRPSQTFELPSETRQPWTSQSNTRLRGKAPQQQQHRRPIDVYGSPPVNWPIRPPPLGRPRQPSPHDIYGPPAELPSTADEDIGDGGFRADYEYEQYPEEEGNKAAQQYGGEQKKPNAQKSEQYVDTALPEIQRKTSKDDKLENFEIPLELLRSPVRYEAI